MNYSVVVIHDDHQEAARYSSLIQEVAPCHVQLRSNLIQEAGGKRAWGLFSVYDLAVIGLSAGPLSNSTSNLPRLSLLEQIQRESPSTSVIVVAYPPILEEAVAAIRMGAEDYLSSDFAPAAFQVSVKRSLNKKELFFGKPLQVNAARLSCCHLASYGGAQQLAFLDHATGLYNTRYLDFILDREILNAQETRRSFAVLFLDADHFKSVNDVYGHSVGTRLLQALGSHLKKIVRPRDSVFRYGGDEFVAVLPGCEIEAAMEVAQQMRASVEQKVFLKDEGLAIQFTISIGIAVFPTHASSQKAVLEAADRAMYRAKKLKSRNSIYVSGTEAGREVLI